MLKYESSLITTSPDSAPYPTRAKARRRTWADTFAGIADTAAAWVPLSQLVYTPGAAVNHGEKATGQGYWGMTADELVNAGAGSSGAEHLGDSGLLDELSRVVVERCSGTEGIFRIAPNVRIFCLLYRGPEGSGSHPAHRQSGRLHGRRNSGISERRMGLNSSSPIGDELMITDSISTSSDCPARPPPRSAANIMLGRDCSVRPDFTAKDVSAFVQAAQAALDTDRAVPYGTPVHLY